MRKINGLKYGIYLILILAIGLGFKGTVKAYTLNCFEDAECTCHSRSQCMVGRECDDGCPGHDWQGWYQAGSSEYNTVVLSYPTCTESGVIRHYVTTTYMQDCSKCPKHNYRYDNSTWDEITPALGHAWQWQDLYCQGHYLTLDTGMHQQYCTRCGATQNYGHHGYVQTNNGFMTCTSCGHAYQVCYNVEFDYNLGTDLEGISGYDSVKYFDTIHLPNTEREGYTFKGWQCYSGATKYSNYTDTDPLTNGNSTYLTGSTSGLCYNQGGTVVLIAIWEHEHSDVSLSLTLGKSALNSKYYYYTTNPRKFVNTDDGYYINTNQYTSVPFTVKAECKDVGTYYKIVSYGLKTGGSLSCSTDTSGINLNNLTSLKYAFISGNAYGEVWGHCETECTWHDSKKSCSTNPNKAVETVKTCLIGDCDAPEIHGVDIFEQLEGIDKTEVAHLMTNLYVTDDISGIKPSSNIYIVNEDNGLSTSSDSSIYPSTWRSAYGVYDKFTKPEIDLMQKDSLIANLFNGKVVADYNLVDNVGNENINGEDISIFDMDIALESYTYNPSHRYIDGDDTSALAIEKGEACKLTVRTTGYANAIRIQFPSDWYIDEDYPIYVYWGDEKYDSSKLIPITQDYFYINPNNDTEGNWVQDIIFIAPLYCDSGRCFDALKVVGYKGNVSLISKYQIRINKDATSTIEQLTRSKDMYVLDESIKDGVYTSIKKTYR